MRRQRNQTISASNENVDNFALIQAHICRSSVCVCERDHKALVRWQSRVRTFMLHFDSPLFEPNEKNLITDCMLFGKDFAVLKKRKLPRRFIFLCGRAHTECLNCRSEMLAQETRYSCKRRTLAFNQIGIFVGFPYYISQMLCSHCIDSHLIFVPLQTKSCAARSNDEY